MAGKEHVVSMEGIFRREGGETSSGVTEDAQTYSISVESALEARIDTVMEARKNSTLSPGPKAPKIQKITFLLRDRKYFQDYEPRAISLGPIHHGGKMYKQGEKYKLVLTYEFVGGSKEKINDLYKKIGEKIEELKECFEKEVIERHKDEDLIWLLLVDGCAILQYIDCAVNNSFYKLNTISYSFAFIQEDLFLLENQLPYRLLNWLMTWSTNEDELRKSFDTYINAFPVVPPPDNQSASWKWLSSLSWRCSQYAEKEKVESPHSKAKLEEEPIHLLDLLRTRLLGENQQIKHKKRKGNGQITWQPRRINAQKLRAAGIHFERAKKKNKCLRDVHFTKLGCLGYLWLSSITVDVSTRPMFLNLIAYEMCPDFKNDFGITSYVSFLDSLIREANDVEDLRKAGILHNYLGSDDEVARVFHEISTDLVPNIEIYSYVQYQIHKHYSHGLNRWIGQFIYDYFDSPWTFLSLVGALLALALTAIQTWYAIDSPFDNFCKNLYLNLTTKR